MEVFGTDSLGRIWAATGTTAEDRIRVMFTQVAKSIRCPLARTLVAQALQTVPERNDWAEVQALYWLWRQHIRYTGDVRDIDTYQTLRRSWELGIADCDDSTIGIMALLLSAGFRAGAKIISEDGETYGHVYPVTELPREGATPSNRKVIALDATVASAYPGWEAPKSHRKLERVFWYSESAGEG